MKKGTHFSPEQSERASQAQIERWAVPGTREQQSAAQSRRWTPERRGLQSVTQKNRFAAMDETEREQFRKSVSEGQTIAWENPSEARKQMAERLRQIWAEHRAAKQPKRGRGRGKDAEEEKSYFRIGVLVENEIPAALKLDRHSIVTARRLVSERTRLEYDAVAEYHRRYRRYRQELGTQTQTEIH